MQHIAFNIKQKNPSFGVYYYSIFLLLYIKRISKTYAGFLCSIVHHMGEKIAFFIKKGRIQLRTTHQTKPLIPMDLSLPKSISKHHDDS